MKEKTRAQRLFACTESFYKKLQNMAAHTVAKPNQAVAAAGAALSPFP